MFFVYGRRFCGDVDAVDGVRTSTLFLHVWWMPLIPVGSYVRLEDSDDGAYHAGFVAKSIAAGYLRAWSLVWALLAWMASDDKPLCATLLVAAVGGLIVGWLVLGKVSKRDEAQRRVYAAFVGQPADIGFVPDPDGTLRAHLVGLLAARHPHLTIDYRGHLGHDPDFLAIARRPDVHDLEFLRAALALARLAASEANEPERSAFAAAHAEIWAKLEARLDDPGALGEAPA